MKELKIKKIIIITGAGDTAHEVGENGVTRIDDVSNAYENSIEFMYQIWIGDQIKFNLVNCPVEIEYYTSSSSHLKEVI